MVAWGCCTSADNCAVVEAAGYDYLEPAMVALHPELGEDGLRAARAALAGCHLPVAALNQLLPATIQIVAPPVDEFAVEQYLGVATRWAAKLGADVIVFGSRGARNAPPDMPVAQVRERLRWFLGIAARHARASGVTVAIEPLCRPGCNTINTVAEAVELVREVGQPEIRVLADLFHMAEDGEPLDDLLAAGPYLRHVHVPVPGVPELQTQGRQYDYPGFFRALRTIGYDGRISVEDNGRRFRAFGSEIRPVLAYLQDTWDRARGETV